MEDRSIPKQLNVPPMPQMKFGDAKADVTIDSLIRMLEICKQEVGGEELVLFRDEDDNVFMPRYPTIVIENTYDPVHGEWLCHRMFIDVRKE